MSDLHFEAWQRPALDPGEYRVYVGQRIDADGGVVALGDLVTTGVSTTPAHAGAPGLATAQAGLVFASHGPRVSIAAATIVTRFPAPGAADHEAGVLAHIQLADPTLPWLRTGGVTAGVPWLAVIVFAGDEIGLVRRDTRTAAALGLDDEPGQDPDEKATVLVVPGPLATAILPNTADAVLLAHVRRHGNAAESVADSVVLANRVAVTGVANEVHLVSIEGVHLDHLDGVSDVTLVSLATWTYRSNDDGVGFRDLAIAVANSCGPLRWETGEPLADAHVQRGVVPLRHGAGVSFCRGPLAPSFSDPVLELAADRMRMAPPHHAEELAVFDPVLAMTDVTYAAAFDLGRSLLLAAPDVAHALDAWRRAERRQHLTDSQLHAMAAHRHPPAALPPELRAWFEALAELRSVPARYLLPGPDRLVPPTISTWTDGDRPRRAAGRISFFVIDTLWRDSAVVGAMRLSAAADGELAEIMAALAAVTVTVDTGFVLRSPLVQWDDLEITVWPGPLGQPATGSPLPLITRDLAPDLRMVLFGAGAGLCTVQLGRRPQGPHYGFAIPGDPPRIEVRLDDGTLSTDSTTVSLRPGSASVIDADRLAADLQATDSAALARQLVLGTPAVRIQLGSGQVS